MVRVIAGVERVEAKLLRLHHQSDRIGTSEEPSHDIALAPHPFRIVRRCPTPCKIEKWKTVELNVDYYAELALFGDFAKPAPEFPGGLCVKVVKLQTLFLQGDSLEILLDVHD